MIVKSEPPIAPRPMSAPRTRFFARSAKAFPSANPMSPSPSGTARMRLTATFASETIMSPKTTQPIRPRPTMSVHTGENEMSSTDGMSDTMRNAAAPRYCAPTHDSRKRSPTTHGTRQTGTASAAVSAIVLSTTARVRASSSVASIAAGVMLIGLAVWLKSGWRSLTIWFALAYAAVALVFPLHAVRYMLPFVPLFALGLVLGISALVKFARPALAPKRAVAVAAMAVVVLAAAGAARLAGQPRTVGLTERESVRQLFDWVRQENAAPNTARVVFFNPRVLTWETGVAAMGYFRADPDRVLSECCAKGITHVIVGDLGTENPGSAAIDRAVEEHPELFTPVFRSDGFTAYRLDRQPCGNTTVASAP